MNLYSEIIFQKIDVAKSLEKEILVAQSNLLPIVSFPTLYAAVVFVNTEAAESGVPLVLLRSGSRPSTESLEIREGLAIIVVSIPEWETVVANPSGGAEDSLPVVGRGVNTTR